MSFYHSFLSHNCMSSNAGECPCTSGAHTQCRCTSYQSRVYEPVFNHSSVMLHSGISSTIKKSAVRSRNQQYDQEISSTIKKSAVRSRNQQYDQEISSTIKKSAVQYVTERHSFLPVDCHVCTQALNQFSPMQA